MNYFVDFGVLALSIAAIAAMTEAVTEGIKSVVKSIYELTSTQLFYISLCIGVLLAACMQVSLFDKSSVPVLVFVLGQVLAGAIASRGANRAHEILDAIRNIKRK